MFNFNYNSNYSNKIITKIIVENTKVLYLHWFIIHINDLFYYQYIEMFKKSPFLEYNWIPFYMYQYFIII